jgi:hypothetical protein
VQKGLEFDPANTSLQGLLQTLQKIKTTPAKSPSKTNGAAGKSSSFIKPDTGKPNNLAAKK